MQDIKCDKCVKWDLMSASPVMTSELPKNYSSNVQGNNNNKLRKKNYMLIVETYHKYCYY